MATATLPEPSESSHSESPEAADRWQRLDEICEWIGDKLNPILVKETRQALKSRQFVTTFSVLLFAALAWTIGRSLSLMPFIYTSPSGPQLLIGYYVILAIPLLMVVPLAAYRSLESEIDDGTLELLSVTVLSPWHIVLGKLASATLQMMMYYIALFPCVAYAYALRGIDLPTVMLIMSLLLVAALLLTIVTLFFAPLARGRNGRVLTLLAAVGLVLGAEAGIGYLVVELIMNGNPLTGSWMFFLVIASVSVAVTLGHVLLTATAAQLTPESENRSTRIRLSMMMLTTVVVGLAAFATQTLEPEDSIGIVRLAWLALVILWTLAGSMMAAESSVMTPRVRRELPSTFVGRALLTWLTPGPTTGLVFATVHVILITVFACMAFALLFPQMRWGGPRLAVQWSQFCIAFAAYLIGFTILVRWIVGLVRKTANPRAEIGVAAMIAVAVVAALVPYSIELHFNDYRPFTYSSWQVTNWLWTLQEIDTGRDLRWTVAGLSVMVLLGFVACVMTSPQLVFPRRIAMPKRVAMELEAIRNKRWSGSET